MSTISTHRGEELITSDFFVKRLPEGFKADLVEGEIISASPASPKHERLQIWVGSFIGMYVEHKELGHVYGSETAFELDEHNTFEPDVSFLARENLGRKKESKIIGPPDVAVEIVSRATRDNDYGRKKDAYERFGTREYWLVDYRQARIEFFRLVVQRFEMVRLEDGSVFRSTAIPGLWLDIHWLLADPLPSAYQCLRKVLGD